MILPAMGIISEIIAVFSRKHIFGYHFIAFSSIAIAMFGFFVWGHHMFVSGQSTMLTIIFSAVDVQRVDPVGGQGVQLAGDDVRRVDLAARRRCCTLASSSCSASAG
jgi:hypothetical protein